ncbi:MAG TPA: hypothetical protein VEF76_14510 [Patescibacteria group bacterium]|nr:hypothetical protein [Patescibacteria group bacterium]
MSEDNKNHQRAEKATTYLAGFGAFGVLSWGVVLATTAPIIFVPAAIVAGVVGARYAKSENGRNNLNKFVNQLVNLGNDLVSHASDDLSRLKNWWTARSERKAAEKKQSIDSAVSTFKAGSSENAFNNSAKPEVVVTAPASEAPKPAVVPPAPKP